MYESEQIYCIKETYVRNERDAYKFSDNSNLFVCFIGRKGNAIKTKTIKYANTCNVVLIVNKMKFRNV